MPQLFLIFTLFACQDTETSKTDTEGSTSVSPETGRMEGITFFHNEIRKQKGIPELTWDEELVTISADWLTHLDEQGCIMEHNWDSPYGENLFWSNYPSTPEEVVYSWASEEEFYSYDDNSCEPGEMCGHYTQIVWANTTHLGCAVHTCTDQTELWMCNYNPAGNWVGERPY